MKKRHVTAILLGCLWLALSIFPAARAQAPQPKVQVPNSEYSTPEKRASIAKRLDSADRDERQKPEELVATLGIKPGDHVADVGSGSGYMLPHLSKAVASSGTVYAEDIYPDFLALGKEKAEKLKLENVRFIQGDEKNPKLPAADVDLVLMLDCYHHFEYPKAMLDNIKMGLKPDGRIAIVDYFKRGGMQDHVRLDRDGIRKEVEGFGWKLVASPETLPNQYILIFKPAAQ